MSDQHKVRAFQRMSPQDDPRNVRGMGKEGNSRGRQEILRKRQLSVEADYRRGTEFISPGVVSTAEATPASRARRGKITFSELE